MTDLLCFLAAIAETGSTANRLADGALHHSGTSTCTRRRSVVFSGAFFPVVN